ncbi:MAG: hypothetical protein H7Y31_01040 [Chitinophagaceae bacterium]|nr:hypothetical protein [Chitinophagaceae bacterium]
MKHFLCTIVAFIFLAPVLLAQRTPVTKKTIDTTKAQTIKLSPPNTAVRRTATPATSAIDANALLPDIKLVSFTIKYVSSQEMNGELRHSYEIAYLLKNEGNVAVSADSIGMQGFISYQTPVAATSPACGALINQTSGLILAPGATHKGLYRCTSPVDKLNNPVYILYVDYPNLVRELNEQNNKLQLPITF